MSQTPLIKTNLLKKIIYKTLPLPINNKSLNKILHQINLKKLTTHIHNHNH